MCRCSVTQLAAAVVAPNPDVAAGIQRQGMLIAAGHLHNPTKIGDLNRAGLLPAAVSIAQLAIGVIAPSPGRSICCPSQTVQCSRRNPHRVGQV